MKKSFFKGVVSLCYILFPILLFAEPPLKSQAVFHENQSHEQTLTGKCGGCGKGPPQGPPGPRGRTGSTGATGPAGVTGPTGAIGLRELVLQVLVLRDQ